MSKIDRLIALVRLKQGGKKMTVREMSKVCGVSQRTLYRYLNTLSKLDLLAELAPFSSRRTVRSDSIRLSADETNLLRYALENNPLAAYSHFGGYFRRLRRKLGLNRGRSAKCEVYQFKAVRSSGAVPAIDSLLDVCAKACAEERPVKIRFRGRGSQVRMVWPRGILVKGDRMSMHVVGSEQGRPQELELSRIHKVDLCRAGSLSGPGRRIRKKG